MRFWPACIPSVLRLRSHCAGTAPRRPSIDPPYINRIGRLCNPIYRGRQRDACQTCKPLPHFRSVYLVTFLRRAPEFRCDPSRCLRRSCRVTTQLRLQLST